MPKLGSKVVYLDIDGQRIRPKFRSHWIKVYSPEELGGLNASMQHQLET